MKPELFSELRKIRNEIAHGLLANNAPNLARKLSELLSIPETQLPEAISVILEAFGGDTGSYFVPQILIQVIAKILEGQLAEVVCDPSAGLGALIATVREATHAQQSLAFTQNDNDALLGKALTGNAESPAMEPIQWQVGDPLQLLTSLKVELDVVASVLPFNAKTNLSLNLTTAAAANVKLTGDLGNMILAAAAIRLSPQGIGIFVVPPSFFFMQHSVLRQFDVLGLGIEAAFALPSGTFAPNTNIQTYLVVVRKRPTTRMFVAELSSDSNTNLQIVTNLRQGNEGGTLELGRFVDVLSFKGMNSIRMAERFEQVERHFGARAVRLGTLATAINLGRVGDDFYFQNQDNAIFIPLIGISDVVDSQNDLTLKRQNYAQVTIDPRHSDARFVSRFLNSEFGKEIREGFKSGTVIPKLSKQTLTDLRVLVPDLQTQKSMLEIETRMAAEENTLLSLQSEIADLRRDVWNDPKVVADVNQRLRVLSARLSGSLKQHAVERLDQWFETLPFPLASILRAWQATPSQDYKTKYEHLLHFFEGAAEFFGIIFLSAFSSSEALFESHKPKINEVLRKQNVSFPRATFGTWKLVVEYLGKQTRQLLLGDKDARALCSDIFSDPSLVLPQSLSGTGLAVLLSTTNKMRNDWTGHSGVVGQEEAQLRNEQLVAELHKLREAMANSWTEIQLLHALHCRPRRGVFENEIAILMGSNSEFLKETRSMSNWLDVERLYLMGKDGSRALRLLPLVQVGPSPHSVKNACYFFNRLEPDGARFVSYHFADQPELKQRFEDATETIKFLENG